MNAVIIMPEEETGGPAGELLALAASRGWMGSRRKGVPFRVKALAAPASWKGGSRAPRVESFGKGRGAGRILEEVAGKGKWAAILNGRFAIEIEAGTVQRALAQSDAGVVLVKVAQEQAGYRERLRVAEDGTVLGFQRSYRDRIEPWEAGEDWPHAVILSRRALEKVARAGGESFRDLLERCKEAGLAVRAIAVGGRSKDLASAEGLRLHFVNLSEGTESNVARGARIAEGARIEGAAIVENGARIEEGAVVIGPAFVGQGARIGRGCVVRGSIVLPGATVEAGRVVREAVVRKDGTVEAARVGWVEEEAGSFRRWPALSYGRLGKRALDIAGATAALLVLAPLLAVVAIAIKASSRGPVFYRERRQGRHGREFPCVKFRTMVTDAASMQGELRGMSEVDGPQFKIARDPRTTLVGAFLRATNLDEIPQFLNVVAGQMSIVGPRPSPERENQLCPRWREARLSVRPGITGLWQVSRRRKEGMDFQEWIYYDTKYVRELSFGLDARIALATAQVLAAGFAALFAGERGRGDVADGFAVRGLP
ncbi:MAG: sugar transferase [Planctomycetota bacterium]